MIKDVDNFNILTSEEERTIRLSLCNTCENNNLVDNINTCDRCACPIEYVVTYQFKECPVQKWVV